VLTVLAGLALLATLAQTTYHLSKAECQNTAGVNNGAGLAFRLDHVNIPKSCRIAPDLGGPLLEARFQANTESDIAMMDDKAAGDAPASPSGGATPQEDAKRISWCLDQAVATEQCHSLAARVEAWLVHRGSPAAGTGMAWVEAQERTGVSCLLMVAIADKESTTFTNGALSRTNHNGWGMTGPHRDVRCEKGFCWWPDWPTAIAGAFEFVAHVWGPAQTGYDLPDYAADPGWMDRVEYVRRQL